MVFFLQKLLDKVGVALLYRLFLVISKFGSHQDFAYGTTDRFLLSLKEKISVFYFEVYQYTEWRH